MTRQYTGKGWFRDINRGDESYTKASAKIDSSYFGLGGRDNAHLGLYLEFCTEEGRSSSWAMTDTRDIQELLLQCSERDTKRLENKVIQILRLNNDPLRTVGFLVNKNLI